MLQRKLHIIIPQLGLLTLFCFIAELFRVLFTLNINYIFLPWNLLLAWIPLYMAMQMHPEKNSGKVIAYLLVWLVFFPNASYIITDFLHLKPRDAFPFWYDSLLLFAFAFTGLLLGVFSALLVFQKLRDYLSKWSARLMMLVTMTLSGYGIYVGRFLRYNSWDLLTSPFQIAAATLSRLLHPFSYPRTYGVTLMAGLLLSLIFSVFESFVHSE